MALLGTSYTIEDNFYHKFLDKLGIAEVLPDTAQKNEINRIIFDELVRGIINDTSRQSLACIINSLVAKGAKGIILGCTEIPLLIKHEHLSVPIFDTAKIHAEAAANMALG